MSYNAFGVGPGGDATSNPEKILDILYAIQSWTDKRKWENGNRGTVHDVKMTRIALGPEAAYYEGEVAALTSTRQPTALPLSFGFTSTAVPYMLPSAHHGARALTGALSSSLAWEELRAPRLSSPTVLFAGLACSRIFRRSPENVNRSASKPPLEKYKNKKSPQKTQKNPLFFFDMELKN